MKRLLFLLSTGIVISIALFVFFTSSFQKPQPIPVVPQQSIPTPTIFVTPSQASLLRQEKKAQEDFAKERDTFLKKNPWILRLPLESKNYFISYDTEKNEFLVTIYFSNTGSTSKEAQLQQAKQDASVAIKNLTGSTSDIKAVYFETQK